MKRQGIQWISTAVATAAFLCAANIAAASTLTLNIQLAMDSLHEDVSDVHVVCSLTASNTRTISTSTRKTCWSHRPSPVATRRRYAWGDCQLRFRIVPLTCCGAIWSR